MNPTTVGSLVFAFTLGGALLGMWLRRVLPDGHLGNDAKDTVKLGTGLVATMTALVLGLVTASAKGSFDGVDNAVKSASLDILTLDRQLARYGPETKHIRDGLQRAVANRIEAIWPQGQGRVPIDVAKAPMAVEGIVEGIRDLRPATEAQTALRERALEGSETILRVRWLVSSATVTSVPVPFLSILLFWLTITFASFGLFAPRNGTVIGVLVLCSLSVAAAVFLVLEMDGPFDGLLRVSPEPLRWAYAHLNQ
jgi:hypothetical protein